MTVLTYAKLRSELAKVGLRHAFSGPLLMVWSIGLVPFVLIFHTLLFAVLWTVVVMLLGLGITADCLRAANVRPAIHYVIRQSFANKNLTASWTKATLEHGVTLLSEIVVRIYVLDRRSGTDPHLQRAIASACDLVSRLSDYATEAEELDRALTLANRCGSRRSLPATNQEQALGAIKRQASIDEIRAGVNEARKDIGKITQYLETLMLNVFQLEQCSDQFERTLELVGETESVLELLKHRGDSRHADRCVPASLQQTRAALETGFSQINFADAAGALQRLVSQYAQLQISLDRKRATASISLDQVRHAAGEIYRLGLGLLEDVLDLARMANPHEIRRAEDTVLDLEGRLESNLSDAVQDERTKLLEASMKSHLERLDTMRKHALRVEQLLELVGGCEASLNCARMELATLNATESELAVMDATEALQRTMGRAKEVQEELTNAGLRS